MKQRHSLLHLLPFILRYRGRMAAGFLMVGMTVVTSMLSPWVLKYVVDDLAAELVLAELPRYAAMIFGIAVVEGFFRFWMRRILIGASRQIEFDLRNDFFRHLQAMPLAFFQERSTGDIMSRATNDLNAVRSVLGPGIMYSVTTMITVVIATGILLSINWRLTLLAFIPLALVSLTVKRVGQQIHDRFQSIQEQFADITALVQENLSGIRVVKAFAREDSETARFEELNREYVKRSMGLIRLWGIYYPMMSALIGMSSVALLWFGGRQVIAGHLSLGEFVAFIAYLAMLTWPTIAIGWVINIFQRGAASMERILEILHLEPCAAAPAGGPLPGKLEGRVEIRNLSFRYPGKREPVLDNITVTVPAGETLAVVGATGSGKSTLVSLLPRLYDPPPGTVFIDGHDILQWPLAELRSVVGFVPQETFLFSDTIRENIAFGCSGQLEDGDLHWAAKISQIQADIAAFPERFQTFVGERGITLSGGQKQRVAISRAVAIKPRILILDDALSSVDTYTEEMILHELEEVMKERTTILVSHRISTVKRAQQIVVLQDGGIVERGTHESLMKRNGIYAELHRKQLLEEELETA